MPGSPSGADGAARLLEPALGLVEPPEPEQDHRPRGRGAAAVTGSSVHPCSRGDRDRLLAELERDRGGQLRRAEPPIARCAEAADLQVRPSDPPRELERLLEVAARVVESATTTAPRSRGSSARRPAGRCRAPARSAAARPAPPPSPASPPATVPRSPRRRASASVGLRAAAGRSAAGARRARSSASRSRGSDVRGALVERGRRRAGPWRRRAPAPDPCRRAPAGKAASSARSVASAAVEDEADVVVGEQARGVRPVARRLRVADRLDHVAVLLVPLGGRPVQRRDDRRGDAAAARAAAGRRTGGGSGTTSGRRRATTTNAFASSSCCRIRSEPEPPVRKSASGPLTRSRIDVRSSRSRTSAGWRSSTSASRYAATVRSLPENSLHEALGIRMRGERDRRQPQPGRPALGALVQQRHGRVGERDPVRLQQPARLLEREAQIGARGSRSDRPSGAGDAARAPGPARVASTTRSVGGSRVRKRSSSRSASARAQLVQVVDHQHDAAPRASEVGQQRARRRPRRGRPASRRRARPAPPRPTAPASASTTDSHTVGSCARATHPSCACSESDTSERRAARPGSSAATFRSALCGRLCSLPQRWSEFQRDPHRLRRAPLVRV